MDKSLMQRVVSMVDYMQTLESRVQSQRSTPSPDTATIPVCQMKVARAFPTLEYLRLTSENVAVNDIIHCKSGGKTIYCQVTKLNPTGVNVEDLEMKLVENHIVFHRVTKETMPHKGTLGYTRKIFIMDRNELIHPAGLY